MLEMKEKNDIAPICPHCDENLNEVWFKSLRSRLGRRYIYFCSKCRKALGVSHRKGFWMG